MPDDLAALRQQLAQLQATVDQIAHDQQIQFTRIAQIQADLDLVRGAWNQLTAAPDVIYRARPAEAGSTQNALNDAPFLRGFRFSAFW
jgi:hypothetical protein